MNRFLQEFFWTPTETVRWIKSVGPSLRLWTVLWTIGKDGRLLDVTELQPSMFENKTEDAVQIFLGSPDLVSGPEWREAPERHLIDFQRSYAVQLVPPVLTPNHKTLLQGQMAILRLDQYEDCNKATKLAALFRRLQIGMRQASDRSRVVVQVLSNGEKKHWKSMLVGANVPDRDLQLKQFAKGAVTFGLERRAGPRPAVLH